MIGYQISTGAQTPVVEASETIDRPILRSDSPSAEALGHITTEAQHDLVRLRLVEGPVEELIPVLWGLAESA
jgi:hypothetical protein